MLSAPPDFWRDTTLTATERRIGQEINRRVKPGHDLWHSAETIAAWACCKPRTVLVALKKFCERGWIVRIVNYGLRTRRAFALLWRSARPSSTPLFDGLVGAENSTESARFSAPTPIEEPEGAWSESVEVASSEPQPLISSDDRQTEIDAFQALVARAQRVFGNGVAARAIKAARGYGAELLGQVLEACERKASKPGVLHWGYAVTLLRAYREEGPPEAPVRTEKPRLIDQARDDRQRKSEADSAARSDNASYRAAWDALPEADRLARLDRAKRENPSHRFFPPLIESDAITALNAELDAGRSTAHEKNRAWGHSPKSPKPGPEDFRSMNTIIG